MLQHGIILCILEIAKRGKTKESVMGGSSIQYLAGVQIPQFSPPPPS